MTVLAGSILALKFGLAQIREHFLKNTDNKSAKNQRKTASSSYPPRSLNSTKAYRLFCIVVSLEYYM